MIRTGIGGWTYPDWRGGTFYPEGLVQRRELEWASRQLRTIEVNGTYHSLQKPESFRKWREQTPEGFVFAIKGSSYVTNRKVLASAGESLAKFFGQGLEELGDRLGPILWQFMGTKKFDAGDVAAFLDLLPRELAGRPLRYAIEAGHESFARAHRRPHGELRLSQVQEPPFQRADRIRPGRSRPHRRPVPGVGGGRGARGLAIRRRSRR
jgi:uncharacterized protein YecE (DUF72 family)